MWLFTVRGFYSVVATDQRERDYVAVRARVRQHLENLREVFPKEFHMPKIFEYPLADYRYRMYVPKGVWARMARRLAKEIDYPNFKMETGMSPAVSKEYTSMLHAIWSLTRQLQRQEEPKNGKPIRPRY